MRPWETLRWWEKHENQQLQYLVSTGGPPVDFLRENSWLFIWWKNSSVASVSSLAGHWPKYCLLLVSTVNSTFSFKDNWRKREIRWRIEQLLLWTINRWVSKLSHPWVPFVNCDWRFTEKRFGHFKHKYLYGKSTGGGVYVPFDSKGRIFPQIGKKAPHEIRNEQRELRRFSIACLSSLFTKTEV